MSKKIILFPFGGNAREALPSIFAVNKIRKCWDIIGFMDDNSSLRGRVCCGVKVLGGRELLKKYKNAKILAVPGNPDNYLKRKNIINALVTGKSRFATIIHPNAAISPDAKVGINTVIMENVVISCGVNIGDHCVILPNTVISHDSAVGAYCCIGSNVTISSNVIVGPESYIGSGASIRNNIFIGSRSMVGLGSNVVSDVKKDVIVAGNPARILKTIESP